jgi:hypothetical protein
MWIKFNSLHPFKVKVYVGGINAVSGVDAANVTVLDGHKDEKSTQGYIVAGEQDWLDGIATSNGKVRQFVAERAGSGYTVEAQMTGSDSNNGIQFEIIPHVPSTKKDQLFYIKSNKHLPITRCRISNQKTMSYYMQQWFTRHGVSPHDWNFIWNGRRVSGSEQKPSLRVSCTEVLTVCSGHLPNSGDQ